MIDSRLFSGTIRHPVSTLADVFLDLRRVMLLGWMVLTTLLPLLLRRLLGFRDDPSVVGARIRHSLQKLGITYIKLGQFMAMRFDILPEQVCRELAGLFDAVPPLSSRMVRKVVETEFSQPVEKLFKDFDWECIAAASVAQVHRATKHDGQVVAIKIQRPGIARIFAADIRNFRRAARVGDYLHVLGLQSLVDGVNEFERYTAREMNFVTEGRTADRLRRNAGPYDTAPLIYWDLTTRRVLTMEFIKGYPLSDLIHLIEEGGREELKKRAPGLDLKQAVQNFAAACLRQLFVTGFFHADPHPGNIFLREDGTVVFVDFGIFGQLTAERRETFASYIENLAIGNIELSYRHFLNLLQPTPETDMQELRRDVHRIMDRWHKASLQRDASLTERHLGTYFSEFIGAIRRNHVQMSMDTLLFWRAILTLDSTALRFGKDFDLLSTLRDFFERTRPTPVERLIALVKDRRFAEAVVKLKQKAPGQVERLVDDLTHGNARILVLQNAQRGRRRRQGTRLVALPIMLGSLAILWTNFPSGFLGQALLWTAILSFATATMTRLVRD
jgi:ubiquinone biosynthesis protein